MAKKVVGNQIWLQIPTICLAISLEPKNLKKCDGK
jgi:hypothetical protein